MDGKTKPKLCNEIWFLMNTETGEIVFEYETYQGNRKKAFFYSYRYAEEARQKYIKEPEKYEIVSIGGKE